MDEFAACDLPSRAPVGARKRLGPVWIGAFVAWMTATGGAAFAMTQYASKAGDSAAAPTSWPTSSHLARTPGRGTVVMIAHTKCACTRASLRELERLMARAGDRAEAFVVFVGPHEKPAIGLLDLRETARGIPGVTVVEDENEARIFGASTSGQVVLYDMNGALLFRGGITPSRGHEGNTAGGETVRRFVTGEDAGAGNTFTTASEVFGCALFNRNEDSGVTTSGVGEEP